MTLRNSPIQFSYYLSTHILSTYINIHICTNKNVTDYECHEDRKNNTYSSHPPLCMDKNYIAYFFKAVKCLNQSLFFLERYLCCPISLQPQRSIIYLFKVNETSNKYG